MSGRGFTRSRRRGGAGKRKRHASPSSLNGSASPAAEAAAERTPKRAEAKATPPAVAAPISRDEPAGGARGAPYGPRGSDDELRVTREFQRLLWSSPREAVALARSADGIRCDIETFYSDSYGTYPSHLFQLASMPAFVADGRRCAHEEERTLYDFIVQNGGVDLRSDDRGRMATHMAATYAPHILGLMLLDPHSHYEWGWSDAWGRTPLFYAVHGERAPDPIVRLLIDATPEETLLQEEADGYSCLTATLARGARGSVRTLFESKWHAITRVPPRHLLVRWRYQSPTITLERAMRAGQDCCPSRDLWAMLTTELAPMCHLDRLLPSELRRLVLEYCLHIVARPRPVS
jgi:hypothetical protein